MNTKATIVCWLGLTVALTCPAVVTAQNQSASVKPAVLKKSTAKKATIKKVSSSGFTPQSDAIKALAEQFKGGRFNCEFDNHLTILPNKDHAGYFTLTHKNTVASMLPVPTNTGALRLESKPVGLVWLQLPTKSMLMNSKIGQRLADDCHVAD